MSFPAGSAECEHLQLLSASRKGHEKGTSLFITLNISDVPFDLHGSHTRYDVSLPPDIESGKPVVYTRMAEIPEAATQTDDVWTYAGDTMYGLGQNDFTTTVLLPPGAELVSVEPKPVLEFKSNGLLAFRFQGARGRNEKFEFKVRYRLAEESGE